MRLQFVKIRQTSIVVIVGMFDQSINLPAILEIFIISCHFPLVKGLPIDFYAVVCAELSKFVSFLCHGKFLYELAGLHIFCLQKLLDTHAPNYRLLLFLQLLLLA